MKNMNEISYTYCTFVLRRTLYVFPFIYILKTDRSLIGHGQFMDQSIQLEDASAREKISTQTKLLKCDSSSALLSTCFLLFLFLTTELNHCFLAIGQVIMVPTQINMIGSTTLVVRIANILLLSGPMVRLYSAMSFSSHYYGKGHHSRSPGSRSR
jgi:hypothetical protein